MSDTLGQIPDFNWYIIQVASGTEKRVKDSILELAQKKGLEASFEDIKIPSVEYEGLKRGKKVTLEKKIMPGYIFIRMHMNEKTWGLVKSIPKVSNFLGNGRMPSPVSEAEMNKMLNYLNNQSSHVASSEASYEIGHQVRVVDGPFESFSGMVEEVDLEKGRLRVAVTIFGRATPIDLAFNQVEKV